MISDKTLYLSEDREKVVNEGDPKAKFLLVRAGQELPDALAAKHGIGGVKKAAPAPTSPPEPSPASNAMPPEVKRASPKKSAVKRKK